MIDRARLEACSRRDWRRARGRLTGRAVASSGTVAVDMRAVQSGARRDGIAGIYGIAGILAPDEFGAAKLCGSRLP